MLRHSVRRTLSSLSLVVLLGAAPAKAQTFTSSPSLSVMGRLSSWVSETWAGLESLAVQVFAQEKDGEGTGAEAPDGSTAAGTSDPTDPNHPDNGAWIDPNG